MNYSTTEQLATSHGVKGIIFGNAGTGKTMLAATAPRPFLISVENGILSLKKSNIERVFGVNSPGISYNIPLASISSVDDFQKVYQDLTTNEKMFESFDTIYIDSLSEIVEAILKNELSGTSSSGNKINGMAAYGEMASLTIEWCKKFRDLPGKHVFLTCKQGISDHTGLMGPSMPGRMLEREIPYLFDEVLQIAVGEDQATKQPFRYIRTCSDLKNYAKDRSGALDPRGELPFLYNIISKISAA